MISPQANGLELGGLSARAGQRMGSAGGGPDTFPRPGLWCVGPSALTARSARKHEARLRRRPDIPGQTPVVNLELRPPHAGEARDCSVRDDIAFFDVIHLYAYSGSVGTATSCRYLLSIAPWPGTWDPRNRTTRGKALRSSVSSWRRLWRRAYAENSLTSK